jgi:hypothetical protein
MADFSKASSKEWLNFTDKYLIYNPKLARNQGTSIDLSGLQFHICKVMGLS